VDPTEQAKLGNDASQRTRVSQKHERQAQFLAAILAGRTVGECCQLVGIHINTYQQWRSREPSYAAKIDAARVASREGRDTTWDGTFGDFRARYLGHPSPPFHLAAVAKLEAMQEGEVGLMLFAPEHGKTTIAEDYSAYKLSVDPDFRITVGSERITHPRKVLEQVRTYMDPNQRGAKIEMIARFGPYVDPDSRAQIWAQDQFQVAKRSGEQRDPSMQAIGVWGAAQGIRSDLFIIDDVQGRKSLGQTDYIEEVLRQDWLSRSGSYGRVLIVGTRVGPDDIYERLIEDNVCDWVIKYPAYKNWIDRWDPPDRTVLQPKKHKTNVEAAAKVTTFLWPERYPPEKYLTMRLNAGEEAWARNYMQQARGAKGGPFNENMLASVSQPWHSIIHDPPDDIEAIVVGLDPGYGKNAVMACGMTPRRMIPLAWRVDDGLENTQAIFGVVEEYLHQFHIPSRNLRVTDVIIEDKAFQRGLLTDEGLKAMRARFGFRVTGHQTGQNKYDPEIGVPQMARAFERDEIQLPGADDSATVAARVLLDKELLSWRPKMRGTQLKQDLVMAAWFCWLVWRTRRHHLAGERGQAPDWNVGGLPWKPTNVGLYVPGQRE